MRTILHRMIFGALCLLLLTVVHAAVTPGSYRLQYLSSIDRSSQPYQVYVPTSYANVATHPVIFIGHGFGGHVSTYFDTVQQQFANTHGFLLVQLEGRGNTFYDGTGEIDFFEVLADLRARYTLDEDRLYFEGGSMGATGAYRLGVRHPDVLAATGGVDGWGDYRSWYTQWYGPTRNPSEIAPFRLPNLLMASCVDVAEGAQWLSLWMTTHTGDTTVPSVNAYNLDARLTALDQATPEEDYQHELHVFPGGHVSSYDRQALYEYFATKSRIRYPSHVTVKTTRLQYGRLYWVSLDRMCTLNTFATVDVTLDTTAHTIAVTTSNALQYTLYLHADFIQPDTLYTISTNGTQSATVSGMPETITLYAARNANGDITGWSIVPPADNGLLRKTAQVEGPIGQAYTSPFLVVYGTDTADKNEATAFCTRWQSWMGGTLTPRKANSITASEQAQYNLILFGTRESNSVLNNMQASLPITVSRSGITAGAQQYTGTKFGAYFVYPNPSYPTRCVVVSHLTIPGTQPKDLEALPWYWPDYVIFDTTRAAGACIQSSLAYLPDTFVEAGYFDEHWQLLAPPPPPPPPPVTLTNFTALPSSPVSVKTTVMLTATATGGSKPLQYRFFVTSVTLNLTRTTLLRTWGAGNSIAWKPTATGTYTLTVEAREQGSSTVVSRSIPGYLVKRR